MLTITVVTVTYNAAATIEETVRSVLAQDYREIEYLIVDGASTDGTLDIIRRYAALDDRIVYISEPDKGLYDAMNKGAHLAKGDYIHFLNSGDLYYDDKVLSSIATELNKGADIVYGDIVYVYNDGSRRIRKYSDFCSTYLYYLLGDCINHQAMFASKRCFDEQTFNLTYRISADREWMIRQKKAGRMFRSTDRLICYYSLDDNSMSVKNESLTWQENDMIIKRNLPAGYYLYAFINLIRNGSFSSKVLHKLYELVFIRKE